MPAGDGTGPVGAGPMTGRAVGYCAGYTVPGYMNPVPGRGGYARYHRGGRGAFGGGRGWRHWYYATGMPGWVRAYRGVSAFGGYTAAPMDYPVVPELTPRQEMEMLKRDADVLQSQLEEVRSRIETLEKSEASAEVSEKGK